MFYFLTWHIDILGYKSLVHKPTVCHLNCMLDILTDSIVCYASRSWRGVLDTTFM